MWAPSVLWFLPPGAHTLVELFVCGTRASLCENAGGKSVRLWSQVLKGILLLPWFRGFLTLGEAAAIPMLSKNPVERPMRDTLRPPASSQCDFSSQ